MLLLLLYSAPPFSLHFCCCCCSSLHTVSECPSNPARKGRPGPGSCSWRAAGGQGRAGPGCTQGRAVLGWFVAKTGLKFTTGTQGGNEGACPMPRWGTMGQSGDPGVPVAEGGTHVCWWHSCITAMGRLPMQMAVCRGAAAQGRRGRLCWAGGHAGRRHGRKAARVVWTDRSGRSSRAACWAKYALLQVHKLLSHFKTLCDVVAKG